MTKRIHLIILTLVCLTVLSGCTGLQPGGETTPQQEQNQTRQSENQTLQQGQNRESQQEENYTQQREDRIQQELQRTILDKQKDSALQQNQLVYQSRSYEATSVRMMTPIIELHKKNSSWYNITPSKRFSPEKARELHRRLIRIAKITPNKTISAGKIEELKSILTNKSSSMTVSEYNSVIQEKKEEWLRLRQKREELQKSLERDNLTSKEKERIKKNLSDIEEHWYLKGIDGYLFTPPTFHDEGSEECIVKFTHNSTSYVVSSMGDRCEYNAWKVSSEGESYVIRSERVTQILSEIRPPV